MHTDLRSLRYVVAVARTLSFTRAADAVGISQPALTRAVQAVERDFGVRLFDRDRSGVKVTAEGEPLIERATALLAEALDFQHLVEQTARGEEGRVAFGMAPFPASALLAPSLTERIVDNPGLANHVVIRDVHALTRLLLAGELEFFLAAEQQVEAIPRIRKERIGSFPGSLIVRRGHPLLTSDPGKARYPLLMSGYSGSRLRFGGTIGSRLLPDAHMLEDFAAIRQIVANSDAVMMGSIYSVIDEVQAGTLVPLTGTMHDMASEVGIEIYWLDRRTRSRGALALRDEFRCQVRQLEATACALKGRPLDQSPVG